MSDIDPYVRVLFLKETPALAVPLAHARKEEFIPPLNKHLSEVLSRHGAR